MNGKNQPPSIPPYQGGRQSKAMQELTGATPVIVEAEVQAPSLDKGRAGEGLGRAGEQLTILESPEFASSRGH